MKLRAFNGRRLLFCAAAALAAVFSACASDPHTPSDAPTPDRTAPDHAAPDHALQVSREGDACARPDDAWTRAFACDSGWTGGDGCASLQLSGGRLLWLFSDSTIGRVEQGKHAPGSTIVNNAVAITRDHAAPRPAFAWGDGEPPHAMFTCAKPAEWYWLAGGGLEVSPDGPLVLFAWRLGRTGRADAGVWDFEGRGTDAILIENPHDDPRAWRWRAVDLFDRSGGMPARTRAWGAAVVRESDYAYIFGVDATDVWHKSLLVARAPCDRLAVRKEWRFHAADGSWSRNPADAAVVASDVADEFSITRSRTGGYTMVHMEPNFGRRVMFRHARAADAHWSDAAPIYTCPEPGADTRLIVYSAKAHPAASSPDGLLVSYCVNSTDFWHMLADASIYRPRFLRVPWAAVEHAGQ